MGAPAVAAPPWNPAPAIGAPSVDAARQALHGELFGVPVGPVKELVCAELTAGVYECMVQFDANAGPTYPEPFSSKLFFTRAGDGWQISE